MVQAFLELVRPVVQESATGAGCAVAAAVTEAVPGSPPAIAGQDALRLWRAELGEHLEACGVAKSDAESTANLLLATLEGAHVLCRAEGSIRPFDQAAATLLTLVGGIAASDAGTRLEASRSRVGEPGVATAIAG